MLIKFDYHAQGMGNCLERVSNNLGRHLEFDPESCDAEWSQGGISWVEDENGRRVEFRSTHDRS